MCFEVECPCGYTCRDHKITDLTCPKCGKMMTAIEQESHDAGKWANSRSLSRSYNKRRGTQKRSGER